MNSEARIEKAVCGRLLHHRYCVGECNYHLQFTPAFRRGVFEQEEVRILCRETFYQKADNLSIALFAAEFGPHAHLFVGNCRKYSVDNLVQYLKGYSSYVIRRDLWQVVSQC